ncbi:MAG: hypothetical protein NVSMB29_05480 [Candidatus Dormibacteria bacterium]
MSRAPRRAAVLVLAGYGLLVAAWVFANPLGAAPDEPDHYVKAIAAGRGHLRGTPYRGPGSTDAAEPRRSMIEVVPEPLLHRLTRVYDIPRNADPGNLACNRFQRTVPSVCPEPPLPAVASTTRRAYSYLGTYQPFVYVPPGVLMRLGSDRASMFLLGRVGFAAMALSLLGAATVLAVHRRALGSSLAGVMVAFTPMVVSTVGTLSASAVEIAAGAAFFVALLHVLRGGPLRRLAWTTLVAAGTTLALSRPLGPAWVALDLLLAASLGGLTNRRRSWRSARVSTGLGVALVALAAVVSAAWQIAEQPVGHLTLNGAPHLLLQGLATLPTYLRESVGVFGWLDAYLTEPAYLVWEALLLGLVILAWQAGGPRERRTLALAVAINVTIPPLLLAFVAAPAGGDVQGRWLLPFQVALPLLCADILGRMGRDAPRQTWTASVGLTVALVQFYAWYQNGRRNAVGEAGPLNFVAHAAWTPPLGWGLWIMVAGAGAVCLGAGAIVAWRRAGAGRSGPPGLREQCG